MDLSALTKYLRDINVSNKYPKKPIEIMLPIIMPNSPTDIGMLNKKLR